ncbi:FAD-dependent oxidoreductase [Nocardioides euryhalodurans]|uniref:FAD-dependent oxidoreductase n=1 Tax=Nocardioides euryhalodurans TaxID=2518370 RepID=UPI001ABE03FE|nr:hypothetical protein [Nocardioides euryhalodurans]
MQDARGNREHAVVLGGSIGGVLAARVLSDHFDRVTIVERDTMPGTGENRRGVPQGRHVHGLLPAGARVVGELFPGLVEELRDEGVPVLDDLDRLHFRVLGRLLSQQPSTLEPVVQVSRPYLEGRVRRRVLALPNVTLREGRDVMALVSTPERDRVTGVRAMPRDAVDAVQELICADLVVDAMGRAGRTPVWLEKLGYERPEEETVPVDVTYTSRPVRLRPGALERELVLVGPEPGRLTGMGLFAYEDDTWIFTVMGYAGNHPRPDPASMLAAAREVAPPEVIDALVDAEPLGEVSVHRFPASRRRRYEKLRRFPEGLLVLGDALCSFNPIYGQGMTVAAEEVLALDAALAEGDDRLARRFFKAAAAPVDVAWKLSVGSDLALPEVEGERSLEVRAVNAWVDRVLAVAEHDPVVARQFVRVIGFLDPPSALFRPTVLRRMLAARRSGPAAAPASAVVPTQPTRTPVS